jgi:hypothetical protein
MPIKNWGLALNQFAIEARKRTGSVLMIFCQLHKKSDRPRTRVSKIGTAFTIGTPAEPTELSVVLEEEMDRAVIQKY